MRTVLAGILILMASGCASEPKREIAYSSMEGRDCQTPLGILANGASASGFAQPVASGGARCESGPITCRNGVWTGSYVNPACTIMEAAP